MAINKRDQQELDQIFRKYGQTYGGCKEDYFALVYLTKKFKCSVEEIAHQVAFGNNDYGIDAYYLDKESRNLYLYQFKWSENHNLFRKSLERLTEDGMERVFGNPLQDSSQNDFLRFLKADLREYKEVIDRVYIRFVFKGDIDSAEKSEGLRDRREELESKKYLIDQYFKHRQVDLIVEFISDKPGNPIDPAPSTYSVAFSDRVTIQTSDSQKTLHVGFISLMDLYRIHQHLGYRFFDRNIRAGLSPNNTPNRKIREALANIVLKQETSPEVFAFNHNGVTLAAASVEFSDGQAIIQSPRLLNGAQTITSVGQFVEESQRRLAFTESNKQALESIRVLAKVVVHDPWSDFVTNVTICNNQQNPVAPWNLRANDRIQCDLQDKLREEVGVFYSRLENEFQNLSDAELVEMGIQDIKDMKIKPLAQTFLAVQGEIDKMSRLPDVFEDQKIYNSTFRESYLHCDARKIVLAYKIHFFLNPAMKRLEEKSPQKLVYTVGRARNLVWALLIQGLLNDPQLPHLLEWFGGSLTKEANFGEHLKYIASSKILPILKDVLAHRGYQEKMDIEQYSFLRTKEIFKRCMDAAYEKYGWTKKTL